MAASKHSCSRGHNATISGRVSLPLGFKVEGTAVEGVRP